jgi:hypothetical protein
MCAPSGFLARLSALIYAQSTDKAPCTRHLGLLAEHDYCCPLGPIARTRSLALNARDDELDGDLGARVFRAAAALRFQQSKHATGRIR